MKNIFVFLIISIFGSCTPLKKVDQFDIVVDEEYVDSLNYQDYSHKYGFVENDTPIWFSKDANEIVIEEIAESFKKTSLKIQGFGLDSILKGNAVENLDLIINNCESEINFCDYYNENKTIYVIKNNNQIKHISIYDLRQIDVTLEEDTLNTLNLTNYKDKYTGSYSLRNLFSVESSSHLAPLDSIKSIQHTFLWTDNGRLDLTWVNERPYILEYWVF